MGTHIGLFKFEGQVDQGSLTWNVSFSSFQSRQTCILTCSRLLTSGEAGSFPFDGTIYFSSPYTWALAPHTVTSSNSNFRRYYKNLVYATGSEPGCSANSYLDHDGQQDFNYCESTTNTATITLYVPSTGRSDCTVALGYPANASTYFADLGISGGDTATLSGL